MPSNILLLALLLLLLLLLLLFGLLLLLLLLDRLLRRLGLVVHRDSRFCFFFGGDAGTLFLPFLGLLLFCFRGFRSLRSGGCCGCSGQGQLRHGLRCALFLGPAAFSLGGRCGTFFSGGCRRIVGRCSGSRSGGIVSRFALPGAFLPLLPLFGRGFLALDGLLVKDGVDEILLAQRIAQR